MSTSTLEAEEQTVTDWLQFIQVEYLEMPGLTLTSAEAQRLWGLEESTCRELLDTLVAARFLRQTPRQAYVLDGSHA
jgi:DNA-binding IclR family transcriptional regulator